jgi:hypothetical protein
MPGVMKITQFWDLFYHLESVPKIKCQGIWFQVSGVRCQGLGVRGQVSGYGKYKLQITETRNLTPDI